MPPCAVDAPCPMNLTVGHAGRSEHGEQQDPEDTQRRKGRFWRRGDLAPNPVLRALRRRGRATLFGARLQQAAGAQVPAQGVLANARQSGRDGHRSHMAQWENALPAQRARERKRRTARFVRALGPQRPRQTMRCAWPSAGARTGRLALPPCSIRVAWRAWRPTRPVGAAAFCVGLTGGWNGGADRDRTGDL